MGYILYPIGNLIEASFAIVTGLGNNMNTLLCVVGAIAGAIWIGLMIKYEKTEVPNR